MTNDNQNKPSNSKSGTHADVSLTDILQAHDILLSILLGRTVARYDNPAQIIDQIIKMTDIQEINDNAKQHIRMLLHPLRETLVADKTS